MFGIDDAIGAGTSLLGGWLQSRAAKKAAEEQRKAGNAAADQLWGQAQTSANRINQVGDAAAYGVEDAGRTADARIGEAGRQGQEQLGGALARFNPYSQAGTDALARITAGVAPGGEFGNKYSYTAKDFQGGDALKFLTDQGVQARQNTALSRGSFGGNFAKEIEQFAQGVGSQEYGKDEARARAAFQMNRDNTLNPLQALVAGGERANNSILSGTTTNANLGLDTAQSQSQYGLQTAQQAGNYRLGSAGTSEGMLQNAAIHGADLRTGAAASGAAGTIGSGNAWADALSNLSKSVDFGGLTRRKRTAKPAAGVTWGLGGGE